ncbi:hypothetical protein ACW7GZ_14740 [Luteimonas sp. A537]
MIDKSIVNPGMHKQFLRSRFNSDEQRILDRLSQDWYLTSSGEKLNVAQSVYDYFLMKPTPRIQEMFNIERELLCVFSDYSNFEPRSLDMFDKARDRLPKMRTETVCEILISRASDVEEKVDRILKSDPEHAIVIPLTYDELLKANAPEIIENRFRKHFYSRDLFSFLSPLKKDTYFFGRNNLINDILNRFKSGEHTGLFGLRKSGKTSIVYAIERRLVNSGESFVSIDCESPSVHLLRWNELLGKLVQLYAASRESKIKITTEGRYTQQAAADSFETDILKIFRSKKPSPTLFIFDEIERLTPGTASSAHWRDENDFIYFWQTLRSVFQKNPTIYSYMLVGTNPNCVESVSLNGHENPLYASVPSQYLPAFTLEQVTQMVSALGDYMGLKFDPIVYSKLTEDLGGHPFLIRQLCSQINKKAKQFRPARVDKPLYAKAKAEFDLAASDYLEMMIHVLRDWYPDEYDMLRFLAQGDTDSFQQFATQNTAFTRHLVGYGLIQHSENGYSFNLDSLAPLMNRLHQHEAMNLTQEQKIHEISSRRSSMEKALRKLLRSSFLVVYGAKKGADNVRAALQEQRRGAFVNADLGTLLSADSSPLYLLELANIFRKEWGAVQNLIPIDKAKFIMMLEEINSIGRPDAHAKSISKDEFLQLRLYFKQIEDFLEALE